jgi:Fic family protein
MIEPNEFRLDARVVGLLAQVDEFKGRWREMTWLSREVLQRLRRTATIESVGSSTRIEGASLTDREVETLLDGLERQDFRNRDEEEVAGYAAALSIGFHGWNFS